MSNLTNSYRNTTMLIICKTAVIQNFLAMLILLQCIAVLNGYVSTSSSRILKDINADLRIFQGDEASLYEYTFMAILVKYAQETNTSRKLSAKSRKSMTDGKGRLVCGGAIVHPEWVLTSAICFNSNTDSQFFEVYAGIIDLTSDVGQQIRHIERVSIHPLYEPYNDEFNIAMVKVSLPFKITPHVSAGNLPVGPLSITGTERCHILGFVREYETAGNETTQKFSERLMKVQLHAVQYRECLRRLQRFNSQKPYTITKKNYCLVQIEDYPHNDSQGACEGDVGGPCICGFKIQGMIAHFTNETCFKVGYPTTIVDVGYHLNWVRANILQLNIIPKSLGTIIWKTLLLKIFCFIFLLNTLYLINLW